LKGVYPVDIDTKKQVQHENLHLTGTRQMTFL